MTYDAFSYDISVVLDAVKKLQAGVKPLGLTRSEVALQWAGVVFDA